MSKIGLNLGRDVKIEIDNGEDFLHQVYKPVVAKGRVENILGGMDGGSTQNRVCFMRRADEIDGTTLDEIYVIPSEMVMSNEVKEITPKGEELYHKMESIITHNGMSTNQIFAKARVLRGSKLLESSRTSDRINSAVPKVDTPAFYLNLIDALAYGLIMDCARRKVSLAETYNFSVAVSLPPNDKRSEKARTKFLNNFINPFNWANIDLGINFTINITEVHLTTEPGAAIRYWSLVDEEIVPEDSIIVGLDGGGRSLGSDVLEYGLPIEALSEAFDYGGTQLAQLVTTTIMNKEGIRVREKDIKKAIETGMLKQGNSDTDVVDSVVRAKKEIADNIYNDLVTTVFGKGKISLRDVHLFIFTGRLFAKGKYGYSIADAIMVKIRDQSPDAECRLFTEDYAIPSGNLAYALNEFGSALENNIEVPPLPYDDYEDEVAATEVSLD